MALMLTPDNVDHLPVATYRALVAAGWVPPIPQPVPVDYCLDGYSPDMRCEAPKGHVIDPRDTDTWHRKGAVRWSGWTGGGLT